MMAITVKKSPTHSQTIGFISLINKTFVEPIKPKMIGYRVNEKHGE
jgi:hypothetical protein